MSRITLALALLLAAAPSFAARRRVTMPPIPYPACAAVEGIPAVTFSRDGGATLAPVTQKLDGIGYTFGLAALDLDDTLLAIHKQTLSISTDGGCSWRDVATLSADQLFHITPAAGGRAYIWDDNRDFLARYASGAVTTLKQPAAPIGLGVDATGNRVLLGGNDGSVWESLDSGATWTLRGTLPPLPASIYYRFAFDPNAVDHVVAGVGINGAYASRDGGRSWVQSTGLGRTTNIFNVVVSPADPNVVWAEGVDTAESLRHVYLSRDGGTTFTPVLDESPEIELINGNIMAAHPTDPNVLYFIFGTYFQGHGTDIYRYDAAGKSLIVRHNDYDDIDSIAFSRRDPNVMYFGLESERRNAP